MATTKSLTFTFTASPIGGRKGVLSVQASYTGTDRRRTPLRIEGLTNPNMSAWDRKQQRFLGGTQTDVDNNKVLDELRVRCNELLSNPQITSPRQFIDALRTGVAPEQAVTLSNFIEELIVEQKQNPTCNYQLYVSLLHNLKGENHRSTKGNVTCFEKPMCDGIAIADTPLEKIADPHLFSFANWVKRVKQGANYRNLNATLHHVISIAQSRGKNQQTTKYKFRNDAPKKVAVKTEADKVLSLEQFKAVTDLCDTVVNPTGYRNRNLQALYLDTALLMYYTMSRDADVLLFRSDMICTNDKGKKVLRYIPYKKRTYVNATKHTVSIELCPEALAIIEKYSGQSKGGYLLPLPLNETDWDITTVEGNSAWRVASTKTLACINKHLKKVGDKLNLNFPLSLYAFRRSSISHALDRNENIAKVAKRAGTSVKMIAEHYYKDTEI